jgi:hypothetical protein
MALFDLVCPHCQSGLVVDTTAGATATVGESLKIVSFASPEDMASAEATIANAQKQAEQGRMTHAQALADIEGAQTASRLATQVRKAQADAAAAALAKAESDSAEANRVLADATATLAAAEAVDPPDAQAVAAAKANVDTATANKETTDKALVDARAKAPAEVPDIVAPIVPAEVPAPAEAPAEVVNPTPVSVDPSLVTTINPAEVTFNG